MRKIENKGITLIALVITIIVLLILAGVSIATLTGENGILTKANNAKKQNEQESIKEEIILAIAEFRTQEIEGDITLSKLKDFLSDNLENLTIVEYNEDKLIIEYKYYEVEIDKYFQLTIQEKGNIKVSTTLNPSVYYTAENVEISISVKLEEGLSLIDIKPLSEGIEIIESNKLFRVNENGTYQFEIIASGEENRKKINIVVNNIDKEKPTIEDITAQENSTILKANDDHSGIVGYAITELNEQPSEFVSCTKTNKLEIELNEVSTAGIYYAWVIDEIGNISESKKFSIGTLTYLYNEGVEEIAIDPAGGGYQGTLNKGSNYLCGYGSDNGSLTIINWWHTRDKINLSGISKIYFEFYDITMNNYSTSIFANIFINYYGQFSYATDCYAVDNYTGKCDNIEKTLCLNTSNLNINNNYYIGFGGVTVPNYNGSGYNDAYIGTVEHKIRSIYYYK